MVADAESALDASAGNLRSRCDLVQTSHRHRRVAVGWLASWRLRIRLLIIFDSFRRVCSFSHSTSIPLSGACARVQHAKLPSPTAADQATSAASMKHGDVFALWTSRTGRWDSALASSVDARTMRLRISKLARW